MSENVLLLCIIALLGILGMIHLPSIQNKVRDMLNSGKNDVKNASDLPNVQEIVKGMCNLGKKHAPTVDYTEPIYIRVCPINQEPITIVMDYSDKFTIGTGKECDIRIEDDVSVEKKHAEIIRKIGKRGIEYQVCNLSKKYPTEFCTEENDVWTPMRYKEYFKIRQGQREQFKIGFYTTLTISYHEITDGNTAYLSRDEFIKQKVRHT